MSLFLNTFLLILITSIVWLVIYKIFFSFKTSKHKNEIIIIGPSQSGKTTFFFNILNVKDFSTVVSMHINKADNIKTSFLKKLYTFLDIPGQGYFKETIIGLISTVKLILLFVDSSSKQSITWGSEFLYDILNSDKFCPQVPLIIACNKQDSTFPKTKKMIENELCNEIDNIKNIKQKNNWDDNAQVGTLFQMKSKFSFSIFKNVNFVECDMKSEYKGWKESMRKLLEEDNLD